MRLNSGYRLDLETWCFVKFSCCVIGFWALVFLQYAVVDHSDTVGTDKIHYKGFRHVRLQRDREEADSDTDFVYVDELHAISRPDEGDQEADRVVPRYNKIYDKDINHIDMDNVRQKTLAHSDSKGNVIRANSVHGRHEVKILTKTSSVNKDVLLGQKNETIEIKTRLEQLVPRSPISAPGEYGKAVNIDKTHLAPGDQLLLSQGYNQTGFNRYISDMISIRRRTPDLRPAVCRRTVYSGDLPQTSVIICFHNEAQSALLRTVFSVLDNTPSHLLREILLVDDFSDHVSLATPLDEYVQKLPKVRLIRASTRLGLIGARLLGTVSSTAPVLTFLDSHVECLQGWLEPMLSAIRNNEYTVPYPVMDGIDRDNFNIFPVETAIQGLFNWIDMSYLPSPLPPNKLSQRKSVTEPIASPTMPGGIFSISRRFFNLLGRYDPGLKTWGSENMELSFKVWLCNGTVKLLPCSHIGHIFRSFNPNLDKDYVSTIQRNAMRVSYVWMDDYKYLFFNNIVRDNETPSFGDVTDRIALRQKLKCRNFDWYMKNIATDHYAPIKAFVIKQIVSMKSNNSCLAHSFHKQELWLGSCNQYQNIQRLWYLDNGQLLAGLLGQMKPWMCLTVDMKEQLMLTQRCDRSPVQQWVYTSDNSLRNVLFKKCVERTSKHNVRLSECSGRIDQKWMLQILSYKLSLPVI